MDILPVIDKIKDEEGLRSKISFKNFIKAFENVKGEKQYVEQIDDLRSPERNTLIVEFMHINQFSAVFASTIELQFYRLYPFLCLAIRELVVDRCEEIALQNHLGKKEFYLGIVGLRYKHQIRHLASDKIGKLLRISGQVIRTHPVHPELCVATFICGDCGLNCRDVIQQFKYTQPQKCDNPKCPNRTRFTLHVHESHFTDFQRVRIQEPQEELPLGSVPRNIDVIVRGEAVETAQPGDHCDFVGTLVAIPDVSMLSGPGVRAQPRANVRGRDQADDRFNLKGLKSLGVRDLSYKLTFVACSIAPSNPTFGGVDFSHEELSPTDFWAGLLIEDKEKMKSMSEDKNIVQNICEGLFPNIFGNKEVKLGIVLQLFGGVTKQTHGISLRGDINICLVGDPSCGKSQFLKTIEKFSQRVIYTSGKAASAAGLTAAVVKDEESFDFVIEAGALMLADNGICCIDEFDKMDQKDQVAIHEAMEQQTISITKAGVKATLNARCSILAAANPIGGKYDSTKRLRQNINLSPPIISRFDLFFVLIDSNDNPVVDYEIAKRILDNHHRAQNHVKPNTIYTTEDIRKYIMFARCFRPQISSEAEKALKSAYLKLRLFEDNQSIKVTVRQLESLVRLSEAYARLKCAPQINVEHVKVAHDLLSKSIIRVSSVEISLDDDDEFVDEDFEMASEEGTQGTLTDITNQTRESEQTLQTDKDGKNLKQHLKISQEQYLRITNMLVLRVREDEEKHEDDQEWKGVRKSCLTEWYMETIENDLDTVEEYHKQKSIIDRVIPRLLHDQVLVEVEAIETDGDETQASSDMFLIVNPNYCGDE